MIQRIQSIYLLLVTVLMSFLLIRPYAEMTLTDGSGIAFHSLMPLKIHIRTQMDFEFTKHTIPLFLLISDYRNSKLL